LLAIYKICTAEEWTKARHVGKFTGSEVDLRDGFIHFSTREQLAETAARHFLSFDRPGSGDGECRRSRSRAQVGALARWRTVSASLRAARHSGGDTSEGIAGRPSASGTSCELAGLEPFRFTGTQETPALELVEGRMSRQHRAWTGLSTWLGPPIAIRGGSERLYVVARR
jgi:hypothetical protein